jgi:hypothetical protein
LNIKEIIGGRQMTLFLCGLHIRKNPLFAAFCVKSEFLYIYGKIMRGQHEQPDPAGLAEKQTKFTGWLMGKKTPPKQSSQQAVSH